MDRITVTIQVVFGRPLAEWEIELARQEIKRAALSVCTAGGTRVEVRQGPADDPA